MKEARRLWLQERQGWRAGQLVFLDETALNTRMGRLYGRSPKGERCVGHLPAARWESFTFLAALRCGQVCAPWLMDGAMLRAWVEHQLAPALRPGDLVICDNLSCHTVAGCARPLRPAGPRCGPCPPTARTSTPSSRPSPS